MGYLPSPWVLYLSYLSPQGTLVCLWGHLKSSMFNQALVQKDFQFLIYKLSFVLHILNVSRLPLRLGRPYGPAGGKFCKNPPEVSRRAWSQTACPRKHFPAGKPSLPPPKSEFWPHHRKPVRNSLVCEEGISYTTGFVRAFRCHSKPSNSQELQKAEQERRISISKAEQTP